ncbi:MAG: GNAT family N-acetyltransferase [Geothrix sp.]|uniref:GNAT family N-acetyltransferase n=1 Tax=Geothrix sp. TaxID=1962974 RepID=UPI0017FBAFCF|nr:GNAT family N-acetyltransferase [Geothrix sp.]NWJ42397.1 GNAT family N-acetyltransferase [Geothrix sp.]WIL19637.1 MAG: GNAT family N-acetyltransferase [Geothrix sp.]
MVIRTALPTEAQALALLGERLWRETYTGLIPQANLELHLAETFGLVQQTGELVDPANWTLVVDVDGAPLGYALLRAHGPKVATAAVPFERPLEVARFYVDRTLHGRGAAQALMAEVLARAGAAGHDGVWLQVWEQNPRAIRFYAKVGFIDAGDATYRIGEQVDRDRLLVQALTA